MPPQPPPRLHKAVLMLLPLTLLACASVSADAPVSVLQAVPPEPGMARMQIAPNEEGIRRTGQVRLDTERLMPPDRQDTAALHIPPAIGDTLALEVFEGTTLHMLIDQRQTLGTDQLLLQGHIPGHDLSTFSITLTGQSYLMTLEDPENDLRYRVVGDTATGQGTVTEWDLRAMPPTIPLPPLLPPTP